MKKLIVLIALALTTHANAAWLACNTAGKAVTVTQASGDIATLALPVPGSRPSYVAFLTTQSGIVGNLLGKTITATFYIANSPNTVYEVSFNNTVPASVIPYFTSATGYFNFNDSDSKHPSNYWWNGPAKVACVNADDGVIVTVTATIATNSGWTDSHGQADPTAFTATATNVRQIGFAFGGHFFDTGIRCSSGTATLHLLSYDVQ